MKWLLMIFASMVILYSPTAKACSFRISGGELILCGMTKIEVMNKIGNPDMRDRQTIGVNNWICSRWQISRSMVLCCER